MTSTSKFESCFAARSMPLTASSMLSSVNCEIESETVVMSTPSGTISYYSRIGRGGTGVGQITPTCSRHPVMPWPIVSLLLLRN